jgi:hypothetical protein
MPFTTAKQVRTAIDNADLAIRRAIEDGTLLTVINAMKAKIVSCFISSCLIYMLMTIKQGQLFEAKKNKSFAAEFKVPRHLWDCLTAYMVAQKVGALDGKFVEDQGKALDAFLAKEEEGKNGKGKAKDTVVGAGKGSGRVSPKQREWQPEAGPSRIRATSPPAEKNARTVGQRLGAANAAPSGAGGAGGWRAVGAEPLGAEGAAASRAEHTVPPRPSVPQPATVWQSRFHPAVPAPKTSKAPRMHGPPTDEMARLSVGERQKSAKEGASRSHRRLGSLEEEIDVEGEDGPHGSKRKRSDEGERDYSDGEEEKEDKDDEGIEERKVKRPRAGGSKRKVPEGTGEYYRPACEPCKVNGTKCEKQEKNWACVRCATKKVACKRGQDKRRNARDSEPEDDSDEPGTSEAEQSARQRSAVPMKRRDRKGKGRGRFTYYVNIPC